MSQLSQQVAGMSEVTALIGLLEGEEAALKKSIESLVTQKSSLETNVTQSRQELQKLLNERNRVADEIESSLSGLQTDKRALTKEIADQRAVLEGLDQQIKQLTADITRLTDEATQVKAALDEEIATKQREAKALTDNLAALRMNLQSTEASIEQAKQARQQVINGTEVIKSDAEKQHQALLRKFDEVYEDLRQREAEQRKTNAGLEAIERKAMGEIKAHRQSLMEREKKLNDFEQSLLIKSEVLEKDRAELQTTPLPLCGRT